MTREPCMTSATTHLVEAPHSLIGVCLPEHVRHAAVLDRPAAHALCLQQTPRQTCEEVQQPHNSRAMQHALAVALRSTLSMQLGTLDAKLTCSRVRTRAKG